MSFDLGLTLNSLSKTFVLLWLFHRVVRQREESLVSPQPVGNREDGTESNVVSKGPSRKRMFVVKITEIRELHYTVQKCETLLDNRRCSC